MRICLREAALTAMVATVTAPALALAQETEVVETPQWRPAETQLEMRAGVAHTDNAAKTNENEQSDTIVSAGLGIDYKRQGAKLDVTALGSLDWVEYLDDTFDGELLGYFDGSATWDLMQESLQWTVRDSYGQLITDPLRSDSLDNLDAVNFFSTGPRANFRLGSSGRLSMYALYSQANYEELDSDYEQLSGGIGFGRSLSEASLISLNVNVDDVSFDNTQLNSDYEVQSAFLRYEMQGYRTSVDADVGYSQVVRGDDENGGSLLRLGVTRRLSPSSNFFLRARQQFANSASSLRDGAGGGVPAGGNTGVASADAFQERGLGVGFNFFRTRTQFGIGADWAEEERESQQELDREVQTVDAYFTRQLRTVLSLSLGARYEAEEYKNLNFDSDRVILTAAVIWQLGRNFALDVHYDHTQRSASDDTGDYEENRVGIRLRYLPLGPRSP
jgi:Putative beta-barrel porin 2